jgi:DNA-directed RNA polymerase subunit F
LKLEKKNVGLHKIIKIKAMNKIILFFGAWVMLLLSSCENSNTNQTIDNTDTIVDTTENIKSEVIFQVPSPDEFISLLKNSKANFKANITAPEKTNFVEPAKQKLNLGVYAADMAYLATFNKFQETVRYFSKVKSMSDQLGITNAIEKSTFDRLENNITNVDSISAITNNSFYNVIDHLQQNDDGLTLAYISTGGWIESMYIAFQLINKFDEKNPIVQRIASQKVVLENLLGMLETLKDKSETEAIRNNLTSIQAIMNQITSKIDETAPQAQDTSKVIIGVKTIYSIDNETFTKLKQTIEKIRNEIIKQA